MKFTFSKKISTTDHLVLFVLDGKNILKSDVIDSAEKKFLKQIFSDSNFKKNKSFFETFHYEKSSSIRSLTIIKISPSEKDFKYESLAGNLLMNLEKKQVDNISIFLEDKILKNKYSFLHAVSRGLILKDYKFEKYRNTSKKAYNVKP